MMLMATQQQNAPEYAFPSSSPATTLTYFSFEILMQWFLSLPVATPELICRWATEDGHTCGEILPKDRKRASLHFRYAHALQSDPQWMVTCSWQNCASPHIQQRSMIRHILSVHLGLLRWTCPQCLKTFARRGTGHQCHPYGVSGEI